MANKLIEFSFLSSFPAYKKVNRGAYGVNKMLESFEDQERTILELKMFFLTSLFACLPSLGFYSFSSLLNFIDHCTLHHD